MEEGPADLGGRAGREAGGGLAGGHGVDGKWDDIDAEVE